MKPKLALVLLGLLLFCVRVQAQEFSLNSASASDDQVLNVGTTVFAFDFSDDPETVNGVDFSGMAANSSLNWSIFKSATSSGLTDVTMSTALNNVLGSSATNGPRGGAGTIQITGLTAGQTYELQLFTAGTETAGSETVTDTTNSSGATGDLLFGGDGNEADSIVETFVASDKGEEDLSFTADTGSLVTLSAINLRQVDDSTTDVEDAPEPATMPLCLTGALLLGWMGCRRRVAA